MAEQQKRRTVKISLAGREYRVVTTATDGELRRLVARVEQKLALVAGKRGATPEAILLTAIALAHDVEEQEQRADRVAARARSFGSELLRRVDAALADAGEEPGAPSDGQEG